MGNKKAKKLVSVSWKAKSYLADVELLSREVECTYFRLLQGIYLTQNQFPDDDRKAARFCKCTSVKEYRAHKEELLKPRGVDPETGLEIEPRIYLFEGKIRSAKCDEQLGHASKLRTQKSGAGTASAQKKKSAKSLKDHETGDTSVRNGGEHGRATANNTEQSTAASTAGTLPLTLNPNTTPVVPKGDDEFEVFWKAYPKREGSNPRKPAREKFLAAVKRGVDPQAIIAGVRAYAAHPATKHGTEYVMQTTRFLNQEVWKDYAQGPDGGGGGDDGEQVQAEAAIPTVVPGWPAHLQIPMAKKYLMVWERDGEGARYIRPKPADARAWPYKNPKANNAPFPRPGEPGCPVSAEAMAQAVDELRRAGHDVTWTPMSEAAE